MIHHISVAAHNPLHVSQVLAELLQGQSIPFPGHPGSYVALAFDPQGTMVEVHPFGTALVPGEVADEACQLLPDPAASMYSANHTAISVPVNIDFIQAIAEREGWRMAYCRRGDNYFDVIEFWVENRLLIELLPPEIIVRVASALPNRYLAFMSPESLVAAAQAAAAQTPTAA